MLELLQSNNMRALVNTFCQRTQQRPKNPFEAITVVVQSFGIGQWLKVELARQSGIAANIDCLLPAELIWRLYKDLLPKQQLSDESPFSRHLLTWRLMQLLPECKGDEFVHIHQYLQGRGDDREDPQLRLFQLSETVAGLFDQYLVYRPDWIIDWESGGESGEQPWQSILWRKIVSVPGVDRQKHRANLHRELLKKLKTSATASGKVLETISIFGLSSLPKMHLQTLEAIATQTDVDIYFLNPCEHYWGDIVSEKDIARHSIRQITSAQGPLVEQDYLEVGNPLLSSMGKQGREFLELLLETDNIVTNEYFQPVENSSALSSLKNDILNLEFGGQFLGEGQPPDKQERDASDRSIQLHSSHSKMREIEILFDQILSMIDSSSKQDRDLGMTDIIVMAPDISQYAPFIQAVFQDRIHFSITDRPVVQESAVLIAFEKLIALPDTRLTATEVIDLLEVPTIAQKFNLDEHDLSTLVYWIRETGIRWESNGASKADFWNLPKSDHNTWAFGLKRLLMGFAVQGDQNVFYEVAPFDVNPGDSQLIGTLVHIIDLLSTYRIRLGETQTATEWQIVLTDLMEDFFLASGDDDFALNSVREVLIKLVDQVGVSDFQTPLSARLVRYWLHNQLTDQHQSRGFISGGITFATLVPMRSVPFKIVCLIGMNDGEYPREHKSPGFDLMAGEYRKGDRSKRNDDRYLFLEALLSAEDYFYVSYKGRSLKDNKRKPASVLVGELDDYLQRIYGESFVTDHPLQPFDKKYFNPEHSELISYQHNWYHAISAKQPGVSFLDMELSQDPEYALKDLGQLLDFFKHPARFFLRRLGIYFDSDSNEPTDTESFELDGLERFQIADSALQVLVDNTSIDAWLAHQRASGTVMEGAIGERQLMRELDKATEVYATLCKLLDDKLPGSQTLIRGNLSLAESVISGEVVGFNNQFVNYRTGSLNKRQLIDAWIRHLFVNALGYETETALLSTKKDKPVTTSLNSLSPSEALDHLNHLAEIYQQGIRVPVAFLPETSWSLHWSLNKNHDLAKAMQTALQTYDLDQGGSEGQDRNYRRLFNFPDDFNDRFISIAEKIYQPIIDNCEDFK